MILALFILKFAMAANNTSARVLENKLVHISIKKIERTEAEPASKPYEIEMTVTCKVVKSTKTVNFPVCDFDPKDQDSKLSLADVSIAHHSWDGAKSSNNPEGRNYCDSKNKLYYRAKISDLCQ